MTFRHVVLSIQGLRERDIMQQAIARRMTVIIASTNMGGAKIASKINKLWPLPTDTAEVNVSDRAKQVLKQFREIEANARRSKNTGRG